jgi:hypothetical protein
MLKTPDDPTAISGHLDGPKPWQASLESVGRRALARQHLIEEGDAAIPSEAGPESRRGFVAWVTVQATLPHAKPKGHVYRRTNGRLTLELLASPEIGLPWGSLPRVILAWITSEAVRTKNRRLKLGPSFDAFLEQLELTRSGGPRGDRDRLRDQMRRLLYCHITVYGRDPANDSFRRLNVADEGNLLWWEPLALTRPLWKSSLELAPRFFNEVIDHPVPVDMDVLRRLRRSPLALDVYTWLTWRMSGLTEAAFIPWPALEPQFGAAYARPVDFRKAFRGALQDVLACYDVAAKPDRKGLLLNPGPTSVPRLTGS